MKTFQQYMSISFNLSLTSSHFHPLQDEDEDDNGKFRLERVKLRPCIAVFVLQSVAETEGFSHAWII